MTTGTETHSTLATPASERSEIQRAILAVLADGPADLRTVHRLVDTDEHAYTRAQVRFNLATLYTHRLLDREERIGNGGGIHHVYKIATRTEPLYIDTTYTAKLNRPRPVVPTIIEAKPERRSMRTYQWNYEIDAETGRRQTGTYPGAFAVLLPVNKEWRIYVQLADDSDMHYVGRAKSLSDAEAKMRTFLEERYT